MVVAKRGAAGTALFFAGRVCAGLGVGTGVSSTYAYIAEVAPSQQRGTLVVANELALGVGCLLASAVALAVGDERWRYTLCVPALLALTQLLGVVLCVPESPRWLALHGEAGAATKAAASLGVQLPAVSTSPRRAPSAGGGAGGEAEAAAGGGADGAAGGAAGSLTLCGTHRSRLVLVVGTGLAQGATFSNAVLSYSRDILSIAHVTDDALEARWYELLIGAVKRQLLAVTKIWKSKTRMQVGIVFLDAFSHLSVLV